MMTPKRAQIVAGGLVVVALAGGGWLITHGEAADARQTTDDAYVQADFSTVAPKVSGLIAQVLVGDNQKVSRGQLLALIDDRDFRVAVAQAEAQLLGAQADVAATHANIKRQASLIAQASAAIDADQAATALSDANARRYDDLARDGSGSLQERQETASRFQADQAAQRRDVAGRAAAVAQQAVLRSTLANMEAGVAKARAALDAARLDLSYTQIRAPLDGVVGRRTLRVGNYVSAGTPLLAVVPLGEVYVEARYRETQLEHIRPGQPATVAVDTLPGVKLKGHVESIAPATGVSFAGVAPENATGNFTKITQRLAVRIEIDPNQPDYRLLRVGMSATSSIGITGR